MSQSRGPTQAYRNVVAERDRLLAELETAKGHRRQWRSIALDVICELERLKTIEDARAYAKGRLENNPDAPSSSAGNSATGEKK